VCSFSHLPRGGVQNHGSSSSDPQRRRRDSPRNGGQSAQLLAAVRSAWVLPTPASLPATCLRHCLQRPSRSGGVFYLPRGRRVEGKCLWGGGGPPCEPLPGWQKTSKRSGLRYARSAATLVAKNIYNSARDHWLCAKLSTKEPGIMYPACCWYARMSPTDSAGLYSAPARGLGDGWKFSGIPRIRVRTAIFTRQKPQCPSPARRITHCFAPLPLGR